MPNYRHRITIDVERIDSYFFEAMAELYLMSPACGLTNLKHYKANPYDPDSPELYAGDVAAYAGGK